MQTITLTQPDDWHIHLRDGDYLAATVPDVARYFARAIVMPNLTPPVTTVAQALKYRDEILAHRPAENLFEPLMTLYLTEQTSVEDVIAAAQSPDIAGCKLYPAFVAKLSLNAICDNCCTALQHDYCAACLR